MTNPPSSRLAVVCVEDVENRADDGLVTTGEGSPTHLAFHSVTLVPSTVAFILAVLFLV